MHTEQLVVAVGTVERLVAEQFPAWAHLPIHDLGRPGTVNALFRIGDELTARLPLQGADVTATRRCLEAEAEAARELHGRTPVPTPEPVAIGEPGHGYPLPWSVQTWLLGTTAVEVPEVSGSSSFALDLAGFIQAVRSLDTRGRTFHGHGRGGDLRTHDEWVETCLNRSAGLFDVPRLRSLWAALRTLPRTDPDVMCHGDLIPGNTLVADGRLTGVWTSAAWARPTLRSTWSSPGTSSRPERAGTCEAGWGATTCSGHVGRLGRWSRRWAWPGTTATATTPCTPWA